MALGMVLGAIGGAAISGLMGAKGAKDAAKEQTKGMEEGQRVMREAAEDAEKKIVPLFESAMRDAQAGFGAALGVSGDTVDAQLDAFQTGNVNAQETVLAGFDPFRAAILGLPIDMSGLQPKRQDVDTSFLQRDLPVKPPPPQNMKDFAHLVSSLKKDPAGTTKFFEGLGDIRQQSIDQDIPIGQLLAPQGQQSTVGLGNVQNIARIRGRR